MHVWLILFMMSITMSLTGGVSDILSDIASIQISRPKQGELIEEGSLMVEWKLKGLQEDTDQGLQVVIMVNGLVVHVSRPEDGRVSMQDVRAGIFLHVHAFLAKYEEEEGITNVSSSSSIECKIVSKEAMERLSNAQAHGQRGNVGPSMYTPYIPANKSGEQPGREPVIIFTFHCNRPDLVLLQHTALSHFMLDEFKLIVINDAQAHDTRKEIERASLSVGADHFITPDYFDHSDPSYIVGKVVTWAVQEIALIKYNDSVMYLWVGLLFLDLRDLPNKNLLNMIPAVVGDVGGDTASSLHLFLDASPNVKVRRALHTSHIHEDFNNKYILPKQALDKYQDSFRIEIYERSFLHYGSASNWKIGRSFEYFNSAEDFLPSKTKFVFWFVQSAVNGSLKLDDFDFVYEHGTWENAIGPISEALPQEQDRSEL
ncbi:hypothetical protein GUITHDRAFT_163480 [Guillardia theta CCMP2712]|uniref:Glycosyltransferase 2-like domain-containing protein n=1 Tax=Guillardia theta (strain CCMP2712) TaxID=905079 RepID=L1J8Q0_GUITC|nr:hypothetical protein GUITHDRAFT_163480 [Guillardia theta CCMP2712]EKX44923.1 hypothetical protein GUITHDRAFT_163480 [Guillardia theta CCMP2712]|eukprot:XP_005831903.1 hypothetical protein GUITHDRAFT_163480 [Guillardia theta CCMP2712]